MQNLSQDEQDILYFYRGGATLEMLSECYGISVYMLKKFLANEPKIIPMGYIWRSIFPQGPR